MLRSVPRICPSHPYRFSILFLMVSGLLCGRADAADGDALRPFCADRPGLGTPACTIDPGHIMLEAGLIDWSATRDPETRTDTLTAADLLFRFGLTDTLEVQAGWTAIGHNRERDRVRGAVRRSTGTGDITMAVRRNIRHPDGSGFSMAIMPYATLPTGGAAIGAGKATAGTILPMSYSLTDHIGIAMSPQVEAAVDSDGAGHHAAYGSVAGISMDLTDAVAATAEVQAMRDDDPAGHSTQTLASLSVGWQPGDALQLDAGGVVGLNRDSPDVELYVGIARRF